ncbi:WecB/TagA/CpsF family glycosyltransferase [Methylosarcina fibrata]|uniref:WecB/TagA/CpsF family glycosyltransferase n=1 Tax=Methylosarcina fibrata TaxID=105972 RepID=UPI0009FC2844|nr:WecB/TagA/CpsF family glycosyltransferase [Methylosarcina fibrata]
MVEETTSLNFRHVHIAGWPIVRLNRENFAKLMVADFFAVNKSSIKPPPKLVFDANGQGLSMAQTDKKYMASLQEADYIHTDGQPLVFASRYLTSTPLPERIATTDFFHDAASVAQEKAIKFFILGASEEINRLACENILKLYPNLQIVGRRNGYFNEADEEAICKEIVESGADVLWVGMGKPREQLFCVRNRERLRGLTWLKTCGGLFDFLAGRNKRAPQWMQNIGLEWLHRMLLDPRRFFWRYLTTNFHAVYLLLAHRNKRHAN